MEPAGNVPGTPPALAHAYLDTETTGLAGGTGTQVFASAVCLPQPQGLEIVQLFSPEPSAEAALLWQLQQEVLRAPRLATYNGGSFDLPLLRTRWIMNRLPDEFEHPAHTDLLTLTRALYRGRLESCALHTVEERLLGFEREDGQDIPGQLVPQAYFQWLRRGWSPLLEPALAHNRQDVRTLHYLHARLNRRTLGTDPDMESPDWLALGRHLMRRGRRADGWRALRRAVLDADGPASVVAGVLMARTLSRHRRHHAAERLLAELQLHRPEAPELAIARAILLEWRLRRPLDAHQVVTAQLAALSPYSSHRADLERRRARLERRLGVGAARSVRRDLSAGGGRPGE
jgi:hypothetical protein